MVERKKSIARTWVRVMDFCPSPTPGADEMIEGGPYVAPEVLQGRVAGQATDQYAVAVLFLELVSGGTSMGAVDTLPSAIRSVVVRALSEEPIRRYPSCGAFAKALRNAVPGLKAGRHARPLAMLLAIVAVGAGMVVGWQVTVSSGKSAPVEVEAKAVDRVVATGAAAKKMSARAEELRVVEERGEEETRRVTADAESDARCMLVRDEEVRVEEVHAEEVQAEEVRAEEVRAEDRRRALAAKRRQATELARVKFRAKDWQAAFEAVREADLEDAELQYRLATCFAEGLGTETNEVAAAMWLEKSAAKGYAPAQAKQADQLSSMEGNESAEQAFLLYRRAAEQKDPAGLYGMARCLAVGRGVQQDLSAAMAHFRLAAEGGHAGAQFVMGCRLLAGDGVAKDVIAAVDWFRRSAERGYAPAQFRYGDCCQAGRGCTRSIEEAVRWYRRAAAQGDPVGARALGICYENGDGVAESAVEAVRLYRLASEGGDPLAQALLSQCLYLGTGVKRDSAEAWRLACAAATAGNAFGQYMAGLCCETGQGAIRSRLAAKAWYEKAVAQGLECARVRLTNMRFQPREMR